MITRRKFVNRATAGAAAMAVSPYIMANGKVNLESLGFMSNPSDRTAGGKYRPPFSFGLGGAPLGGTSGLLVTDEEARLTLENAWESGLRYYDTSPWYGLGLSERRFGHLLHRKPREEYVISTKIGRILTAAPKPAKTQWAQPDSFDYKYDYSASATRRSVEDSLQRLGISSIDIVFIHDLSPDNGDMKDNWTQYFDQAAKGAMPELVKMREEGIIKGWGMGVNTLPPILKALEVSDPDVHLAACQYTLMDHEESLEKLFPAIEKSGNSIVVGSPLNNGFLAGADRYNYGPKIPEGFKEKRAKMEKIAKAHGIDLRTAALQFCAAPKQVSSVIPGARKANQPKENVESMKVKIPLDFWAEMKKEGLIAEKAPLLS
ncbi:aldo/keto reductase [Fulvivirga sediminis]|uniref:Aldo/keto reductase n=1 Tax=Fulvivirga sediminis TaxID=2803949 RepID=A0A937FBR1_9BACT|nr:aldo/keto reductase [Fulvivirga sediminis]MBL3657643.1 aldo/keto reductase [Fulvivirga sediminis]